MSAVIGRSLDLKSVRSAWDELTTLVPLGPITSKRDYDRRVRVLDELVDRIGADESHSLLPLLDLLAKLVEAYDAKHHEFAEATPAEVLRYLMEEHGLKQADLAAELGGQSIVSAILSGKRELNARQVKLLARRFGVSPAVFL